MKRHRLSYIDAGDLPAAIACYAIAAMPVVLAIIWSRIS